MFVAARLFCILDCHSPTTTTHLRRLFPFALLAMYSFFSVVFPSHRRHRRGGAEGEARVEGRWGRRSRKGDAGSRRRVDGEEGGRRRAPRRLHSSSSSLSLSPTYSLSLFPSHHTFFPVSLSCWFSSSPFASLLAPPPPSLLFFEHCLVPFPTEYIVLLFWGGYVQIEEKPLTPWVTMCMCAPCFNFPFPPPLFLLFPLFSLFSFFFLTSLFQVL